MQFGLKLLYEICQKRYVIEQSVESERQQHHPGHWDGHPLSLLLPGRVSAHCSVVTVSRARPARLRALCGTPRVRLEMLLSWPCPGAHRSLKMGRRDGDKGRASELQSEIENEKSIHFYFDSGFSKKCQE